jgi:hypothetical protein
MIALGVALAALTGVALGLLGGGGSILMVPILVYVLEFEAKEAIATSLAVVGVTSLVGMAGHWRAGHFNARVAVTFGSVAMVGTYLGARLAVFVSGGLQLAMFAVVMLVTAFFMFRDARAGCEVGEAQAGGRASGGLMVLEGITVGIFTGLVGVGGGFLVVPALVMFARLPMKEAVGTSLAVIAMKSLAGFAGYAGQINVHWAFVAGFTAATLGGIVVGTALTTGVPAPALKRTFATLLILTGSFVLFENRHALVPSATAAAAAGAGGVRP